MIKTSSFSSRLLLRYFSIFLFAIIFSTTSIGLSYYITIKSLETNLVKNNQSTAIQMKDIVEERLIKIAYSINYLGSSYRTNYLLNLKVPLDKSEPMDMIYAKEYINYIGDLTLANDLISELSVYSLANDNIYTSKGVSSFPSWFEVSFGESSKDTLGQWRQFLEHNVSGKIYPERYYYSNGVPIRVLPLIQKLPLGSKKRNIGDVTVLINCEQLFQGFLDSNIFSNCYITDENSEILYSFHNLDSTDYPIEIPIDAKSGSLIKKIDHENQIVTYARSSGGMVFVTVTPYSEVMSQISYLKIIFYFMIAFSFFAILSASVMFLLRINKPVRNLLLDNDVLNLRIRDQTNHLQVSILCRLLSGFYSSKQEIMLSLGLVGIDSTRKRYSVVHIVIQNDRQQELADYLTIKRRIIELTSEKYVYTIDTGLDCLSLIFEFPELDISICKKQIISEMKEIQFDLSLYKVSILAGCGDFYEDITQIRDSYTEAVFSLKNRISENKDCIFWYNDHNLIPMFFYPIEIEQRILVSTRCGDYDTIVESLNLIYLENYTKTNISDNMSDLLIMKIKTTLLSACNEIQTLDEALYQDTLTFIFSPSDLFSTKQIHDNIRQKFKAICRITSMSQTIRTNQLKMNLLEFIDNHFNKQNMSLAMVADTFNISEAYLSTFFKEQTGINFLTYIEAKRLTMACALLKERSETIDSIAKSIGYTSAHSFRRAFKRHYGISPANYCT